MRTAIFLVVFVLAASSASAFSPSVFAPAQFCGSDGFSHRDFPWEVPNTALLSETSTVLYDALWSDGILQRLCLTPEPPRFEPLSLDINETIEVNRTDDVVPRSNFTSMNRSINRPSSLMDLSRRSNDDDDDDDRPAPRPRFNYNSVGGWDSIVPSQDAEEDTDTQGESGEQEEEESDEEEQEDEDEAEIIDVSLDLDHDWISLRTASFDCEVEGFTPTEFSWDFGDGTQTDGAEEVVHTYDDAGIYAVTCVASDNQNTISASVSVVAIELPEEDDEDNSTDEGNVTDEPETDSAESDDESGPDESDADESEDEEDQEAADEVDKNKGNMTKTSDSAKDESEDDEKDGGPTNSTQPSGNQSASE